MTSTHRVFRFDRRAVRRGWYLGPWVYGTIVASLVALMWMAIGGRSMVGWIVCTPLVVLLVCRYRRERTAESAFWDVLRTASVWFEHGTLYESRAGETVARPLGEVAAIDAVVRRNGRIERLLITLPGDAQLICHGFDDMDAFAAELRRNAPRAKFRRMRYGFPMRLKES